MTLEQYVHSAKSVAGKIGQKFVKYAAPVVAAAAMYTAPQSQAATTISSNISQPDGLGVTPAINYTITNSNAGAVFNSASIQYLSQFADPFAYAFANNSSLQALGITDIGGLLSHNLIGVSIDPSNNIELVNQGWSANINPSTGILNLTHAPFGFEQWRSSTDGNPHTIKFTYNFGNNSLADPKLQNIFDFNGNGIVDPDEELWKLKDWYDLTGTSYQNEDVYVIDGFKAFEGITIYNANLDRFTLGVPEPSRALLISMAAAYALFRRSRYFQN
jgi:hypothetical protein